MPIASPRTQLRSKKLSTLQIDTFKDGVNVAFSETRLKNSEAKEALNMWLIEDGIWDKRPGTKTLITMDDDIDGHAEYVKTDGTREYIICAGGDIFKTTNLSTTSTISGANYTSGNKCFFYQIGTYLYIGTGVDALIRYDGTSLSQYSGLDAMGTVTPSRGGGLSAGSFTYYYKVTAVNEVGETAPSAEAEITVNKDRDIWSGATEYIDLAWSAISGALKYIIYFSDTSGYEVKLAETNTNSFRDDATNVPNSYIAPPTADSTTGPELRSLWLSSNRLWGTDPNNPYRVWFSGAGVFLGNFNTGFGGGWVELERGGRSTVTGGIDYQGKSHVICATPEGKGAVWQIVLESQSISGTSVSYIVPVPTKIIGQAGSNAPKSILLVENDVWMTNKAGVQIMGNEPGVLNVIRTNEMSAKLRPFFRSLNPAYTSSICSYYRDARIFISVPVSAGDPDRTVVFDRERLGWVKDWDIGFSQFGEFTDTNSVTHFLGSDGAALKEISENYIDDDGVAFTWRYVSPRVPVSKEWTQFAKIKRAYLKLRNTQGSIDFTFSGTGKTKSFRQLASATITQGSSDTGIGWDQIGNFLIGSTNGVPTVFADESLIKYLSINKLIRDMQWVVSGDSSTDRAVITGLMAKGFLLAAGEPSSWKL